MFYLLIGFFLLFLCSYNAHIDSLLDKKQEKRYVNILCFLLIFLATFRGDGIGGDIAGYRMEYENLSSFPTFRSLVERFGLYYIGYFGTSKVFSLLGMPVQIWFAFVESFYLFALMRMVNRFSKDRIFSLLVFVSIGLYIFSYCGLKQTLAMGLMMYAFMCFIDEKYYLTVLLIIATYFTHQSALVFLAAFPLYILRNNRLFIPLVITACALIFVYSFYFMSWMVDTMDNDKWEDYLTTESGYSAVTLIFYCSIVLMSMVGYSYYHKNSFGEAKFILGLSILGCSFQGLASLSPSLFRLAYLYTPFLMVLLPNVCYYAPKHIQKPLKFVLVVSIVFYFLYTGRNTPYGFFWQS